MPRRIALVGAQELRANLSRRDHKTSLFETALQLVDLPKQPSVDLVVISETVSTTMPIKRLLRALSHTFPFASYFVWAPKSSPKQVRSFLKSGFHDVILEPESLAASSVISERLAKSHAKAHRSLRQRTEKTSFQGMRSCSPVMWDLFDQCRLIAQSDAPVLILGETGTGKELLARAIHNLSQKSGRFVALDCGAIPENLIESQLFGHEKGSFTGAQQRHQGVFQQADGGTLFFDEVGNISMSGQMSLLRAIQEGTIRPLGATKELDVEVRLIAATNEALESAVSEQRFREDLLYRLDVIRLVLPPLRNRPEDIILLLESFLHRFQRRKKRSIRMTEDFLEAALEYRWPGNVRELENFAQRLSVLFPSSLVDATHFNRLTRKAFTTKPRPLHSGASSTQVVVPRSATSIDTNQSLEEHLTPIIERHEYEYFVAQLQEHRGRIQQTAKAAGIHRRTLLRKLKQYKIDKKDFKKAPADQLSDDLNA